jgi:hypothetical protein
LFKPKNKYGNKKIEIQGVKFDSKLELYCYNLLKERNINFDFQKTIILVDKFRFSGKGIRELTIIVDFVVYIGDRVVYVDTKGFPTEVSKIKYKLLRNKLKDNANNEVVWLHNKKEVDEYIKYELVNI